MTDIPTQSWVRLMPAGNDSACIVLNPRVKTLGDFPVRVDACSDPENSKTSLWRFEPVANNPGHYTIYNKAIPNYLQLIWQGTGLYNIVLMAQTGEKDPIHDWILSAGEDPNTIQISNKVFPGLPLHQEAINNTNAVLIGVQYEGWSIAKMEDVKPQSPVSAIGTSTGASKFTTTISTVTPSPASPSATAIPTDTQLPDTGLSKDAPNPSKRPLMIGISVGLAVLLLLTIAGVYYWYCRRRSRKEAQDTLTRVEAKLDSESLSSSRTVSLAEISWQHDPEKWQTQLRCQAGNLISSQTVKELNMCSKTTALSKAPTWTGVDGQNVTFSGKITLAWKIVGSSRSFTLTQFLVMNSPHFEIILGDHAIQELGLLQVNRDLICPVINAKKISKADENKRDENNKKRDMEASAADARNEQRKKKGKKESRSGDSQSSKSK
ncbi:uncharacterized protein PG986_003069 [Apiospora aurea]|uniref:Ricin B lectin domain-containing protein n=1 Tax=Apiospora aurea TaxID=335848 RepID=A0ABR1QQL8_9PEZI